MDASDWDDRYRDQELVWSAGPNQFVEAICSPLPPGRSLDLAAGEGRNALWLAERGWDSTAVDFSAVAIEKAKAIASRRGVTLTTDATGPLNWVTAPEPTTSGALSTGLLLIASHARRTIRARRSGR